MILVSLRDLQFRRRRFAIATLGGALVLGISLVLSGMVAGFRNEARRSVDAFHASSWVLPAGATGAFLSSATVPADLAAAVEASTGRPAAAVANLHTSLPVDGEVQQVNIHGVPVGSFAEPHLSQGRAVAHTGEVVVDESLGHRVGETIDLNGRTFTIVGRTSGLTYTAHVATTYVTLDDAQALGFGGAPLASAIVTDGPVDQPPADTVVLDADAVRKDLVTPMEGPIQAITTMQWLLWILTAMIIGSAVYLSALDRVRDFAVFKAMGAADRSVLSGLLAQSLLLCLLAYAFGTLLSFGLAPLLPIPSEVPSFAYVGLAIVATAVAGLSSVAGARRALSVDPALAFGGA